MRAAWLALALALPLLAGCSAPAAQADPAPAQAEPPQPMPLVWGLLDCEAITWQVPVPASRLAARLPAGYAPMPAADTPAGGVPAGVDQAATLGFEAVECAQAFGSHETVVRSIPFARVFTPVVPPPGDADGRSGAQHAFVWELLVPDDAWRDRLTAHGLPATDGGTLVGPTAQGFAGRMAIDGVGTFSINGRPGDEQPAPDAPFRDFTLADGGVAALVGQRETLRAATGVGLWSVSAGSWVAEVLGGTQGAATLQYAHYTIPHEAVIRPGADGEPFVGPKED